MNQVTVQIVNKSKNPLPKYSTLLSAGFDIAAMVASNARVMIYPGKRCLVHTGLYVAIPNGYELQIRPRSGLALKQGISIVNTPGTIDADYRGEIGVILINHSDEAVGFANGDRIAQAVLAPVEQVRWYELKTIDELPKTDRGADGFGSTGTKIDETTSVKMVFIDHSDVQPSSDHNIMIVDENLLLDPEKTKTVTIQEFSNVITGDKPDPNNIAETINK